jgi:HEAT repeat protein
MRRLWVVGLLLLIGCGRSTDDWLTQLKDADVVKRREAVRELASHPGDAGRAAAALGEALRDESSYVRRDAAIALGKLGPEAKAASAALLAARTDKDRGVRKAAEEALKRVDPEAAARGGGR